jgi:hypothetical protein
MSNTLDFDRFWAELNTDDAPSNPLSITVGGQGYNLPSTLPAILVLARMRDEDRTIADLFKAGDAIFTRDTLNKWSAAGMSVNQIVTIIIAAERLILGETPDEVMESASERGTEKKGRKARKGSTS